MVECLNLSLLEMPEHTPILGSQQASPEQVLQEKETWVEVVSFHNLPWEVTLYHFCLLLNFKTESLDPAYDQARENKDPASLLPHSHLLLEPLSGCTRRQGEPGAGHTVNLSGHRVGGKRGTVGLKGQTEYLTGVLNVSIVH